MGVRRENNFRFAQTVQARFIDVGCGRLYNGANELSESKGILIRIQN